jgi:hypothetical protein
MTNVVIPIDGEYTDNEISNFAGDITRLTGINIQIVRTFSFSVAEENSALVNAIIRCRQGSVAALDAMRKAEAVPARQPNPTAEQGPRSWRFEKTGELISARELKKRVAAGAIPEMTIVINGKGERWFVMKDEDGWRLAQEPTLAE